MKQKHIKNSLLPFFCLLLIMTGFIACGSDNPSSAGGTIARFFSAFFCLEDHDAIGLSAGSDGRMVRTTDGGLNWIKVETGFALNDVAFGTGGWSVS